MTLSPSTVDVVGMVIVTRCMIGVSTDKMGSVGRLRTAIIYHEVFVTRSGGRAAAAAAVNCNFSTVTVF